MPIYEYLCSDCGHEMEALQKLSDAKLSDCPECGNPSLQKQISAAGFRLKGSGWYETDFKSGSKRNVVESESGSKTNASKSSGKAEASKSGCGGGGCGCH